MRDVRAAAEAEKVDLRALAVGDVLLALLLVAESFSPEATIRTVPAALWYILTTLTTVGYGDIYPVSPAGQLITMLSSFIGIAIVAMPAGVITAGYLDEVRERKKAKGSKDK